MADRLLQCVLSGTAEGNNNLYQPFNPIKTVSNDIHTNQSNPLSESAKQLARQATDAAEETANRANVAVKDVAKDVTNATTDTYQTLSSRLEEGVERTKDYAQHAVNATKDAAHRATDTAKDIYQSAALKAESTLETSKEYVRQNPVPVVLGAIAFGAALGYMLIMARRKPTFSERYVDEPLVSVREAILTALAPVTQRVHAGYDSARDGAGKLLDRVHRSNAGRNADSVSEQIGRVGSNLKFW